MLSAVPLASSRLAGTAGLRVVAAQLAVAIENARLFDAAQQAAVLDERHRLARDLHDAVAQQLFSASLVAQAVGPAFARDPVEGERRAEMLVSLTRAALAEMRALLTELRPLHPDANGSAPSREPTGLARVRRDGLVAALRAYAGSAVLSGLDVAVMDDGYYRSQGGAHDEVLYRIAQEALHNVAKHARATRAELRLERCDDRVRLRVSDDGIGFAIGEQDGTRSGVERGGLGLRSMRERAAAVGGTLRVERGLVCGTVVEALLPLARETTT